MHGVRDPRPLDGSADRRLVLAWLESAASLYPADEVEEQLERRVRQALSVGGWRARAMLGLLRESLVNGGAGEESRAR